MDIKCLPLGNMPTNCYILFDEKSKECAVFDPAAEAGKILSEIDGYKVKYIILTHMHIDHVMALDEVKRETNAPVVVCNDDAFVMNDDSFTLAKFFNASSPETEADIKVLDGDILHLGENELKIIHTPGHTKGSMCVLCHSILISGDTLFLESVGRSDFPGGSHSQLVNSIGEKLYCLNDKTKVYPGHGPETTIGHEKMYNPYL